jgi:hypothetical protein
LLLIRLRLLLLVILHYERRLLASINIHLRLLWIAKLRVVKTEGLLWVVVAYRSVGIKAKLMVTMGIVAVHVIVAVTFGNEVPAQLCLIAVIDLLDKNWLQRLELLGTMG